MFSFSRFKIFDMSDYDVSLLSKENVVFCIVSTTGEGDPPESAVEFFKFLKKMNNMRIRSQAFINKSFQHDVIEAPNAENHSEEAKHLDAVQWVKSILNTESWSLIFSY